MAERKRPTPAQIAQLVARAPLEGRGFKLTLPVKPNWPDPLFPVDRDRGAGVDPSGHETSEGEEAISLRTLQEIEFADYTLGELMRDALKRWGSTRMVAEKLVEMEPNPAAKSQEVAPHKLITRDVAAMQRKVQEWTQGTHKTRVEGQQVVLPGPKYVKPAGRNKRRVVRLMVLFTINLSLGVGGWWTIHDQKDGAREQFMVWNTPGREQTQGGHTRASEGEAAKYIRAARQIILREGEGFVDLVLLSLQDQFKPYPVELDSVHALYVEMAW